MSQATAGHDQTWGYAPQAPPSSQRAKPASDLWGQCIALDRYGQARVAANGELILTDGVETGEQDIRLRLFTRLGELFYDKDFGSLIHDWILEESTRENRSALCAEVLMRVEMDPRVEPYSVSARILNWDDREIVVEARWRFIGEDQPSNLVMQLNKATRELIVEDVSPAPHALQEGI
jgi:phage baseplate assembly protein W